MDKIGKSSAGMRSTFWNSMDVTKECIEGCIAGDKSAQKELFDALLPYLNAICRRYLNNTSISKDVLQDSFITIFSKINQYNSEKGTIQAWSSRVVINNCLKQNNSSKRFFEFKLNKYDEATAPDIEVNMSDEDVVRFLKQMPIKFYEVFMLFVVDGFSHEEIGEMLGIKTELSRTRLARARAWLQDHPKNLSDLI